MEIQNVVYLLAWAALFFLMMRFGCGAHVMGHSHQHGNARVGDGDDVRRIPASAATDLVCGMTVETARAKSAVHEGRAYYFCSQGCREKFEANPIAYVKPPEAVAQR